MTRSIRVAWINDWTSSMGRTPEEEAGEYATYLQDELGKELEIVVCDRSLFPHRDKAFDLVVIDYGGISMGGWDTALSQIGWVCEWAREHPGVLVLIYTPFTQRIYEEIETQFAGVDNIMPCYADDEKRIEKLRSWFGSDEFEPFDNTGPFENLVVPRIDSGT